MEPCADHPDHQRGLSHLWRGHQQIKSAGHDHAFPRPGRRGRVHALATETGSANARDLALGLGQQDGGGALIDRAANFVGIEPQQLRLTQRIILITKDGACVSIQFVEKVLVVLEALGNRPGAL